MNDIDKIRLKEAFSLMSEDNSGLITIDDLHFIIRAFGFTPTEDDLKKIDMEFNINQNIDYLWFIDIMSRISCTKYTYEQIENAFFAFDKNRYGKKFFFLTLLGDIFAGLINVEKFKTAMMNLGEPLTENEMNEMLKDLPVDEDGY
jgi:calmodulin